jgi:hypothetical protein
MYLPGASISYGHVPSLGNGVWDLGILAEFNGLEESFGNTGDYYSESSYAIGSLVKFKIARSH